MAWSIGMLMSKVKGSLYGNQANKMILMGIFIIILTILLLIYIARRITRKNLISQEILKKPFKLYAGGSLSKPFVYNSTKIPSSKNGIEFTYSFWLYTSSFDITSLPKLIFTRGFDMTYGRAVRDHKSQFLNATVEYVPLQRWVQFALIVKDNIMTILMDGELYTIENVLDMQKPNIKPIIIPHSGDLSIGSMAGSAGLKGYITKFDIFKYAINISDVKSIYNKGPFSTSETILPKLGPFESRELDEYYISNAERVIRNDRELRTSGAHSLFVRASNDMSSHENVFSSDTKNLGEFDRRARSDLTSHGEKQELQKLAIVRVDNKNKVQESRLTRLEALLKRVELRAFNILKDSATNACAKKKGAEPKTAKVSLWEHHNSTGGMAWDVYKVD
eukprot:gene2030-biopygen12065